MTLEEWIEYYTNVSASIDHDAYFEQMMESSWNLSGHNAPVKEAWTNRQNTVEEVNYNPRIKNHGYQKYYSGKESHDLNLHKSSTFHEGRESPVRKSIVYNDERKDFSYKETTGQTSKDFSLADNKSLYEDHVKATQPRQVFNAPHPQKSAEAQKELLANRFKQALSARGVRGMIALKRQFKLMDSDNSGQVCLSEFQQAMDDLKVPQVSESELQMLFRAFDKNDDNLISFDEFINYLVGELSESRLRLVKEAFQKLDLNRNGYLDLDEVKNQFDPTRHPDVKAGVKTTEEARFEFFSLFTSLHSANKNFTNSREVTLDDFTQYHQFISNNFERDIEFRNLIVGIWNMDLANSKQASFGSKTGHPEMTNSREQWKYDFHRPSQGLGNSIVHHKIGESPLQSDRQNLTQAAGQRTLDFHEMKGIDVRSGQRKDAEARKYPVPQYNIVTQDDLIERVRAKIKSRGPRGILGLGKSFQVMDDDRSFSLNHDEFFKAMRDYRVTSDPAELQTILEVFDRDGSGEISYDEFLRMIVGEMNPFRKDIVCKAFRKMDQDNSG